MQVSKEAELKKRTYLFSIAPSYKPLYVSKITEELQSDMGQYHMSGVVPSESTTVQKLK